MKSNWFILIVLPFILSCTSLDTQTGKDDFAQIEAQTGGRLGVMLMDEQGNILASRRADERFAMCSTFKLLLSGQVLAGIEEGKWGLRDKLPYDESDLLQYAPMARKHLFQNFVRIEPASRGIITLSDNTVANLLLDKVGGPEAFTAYLRTLGDEVTRLDRNEPMLNENLPNDVRDTTSPAAFAETTRRLVLGDVLSTEYRNRLFNAMKDSETGLKRIRSGLREGWPVGDKTGSCGSAYNDVAVFGDANGSKYVLAVFLNRPNVPAVEADKAIADVATASATIIDRDYVK